jgi:hypothetical protein
MISAGIEAGEPILKLLRERSVWAPQYWFAGTFTSPIVSFSILYSIRYLFTIDVLIFAADAFSFRPSGAQLRGTNPSPDGNGILLRAPAA